MNYLPKIYDTVLGAMDPRTWAGNVCMFHNGRCGSTVTGELLAQHPRVVWDGEVFWKGWSGESKLLRYLHANHPTWYLPARMARFGNSVYGFEMKVRLHLQEQFGMEPERFLRGLRRWGFNRFIVLQRRNQLRRFVSSRVAKKTSRWAVRKSGDHPGLVQIEIKDLNHLVERIRDLEDQDRVMLQLLKDDRCLVLTYEDDIAEDPSVAYEKICSFVGLNTVPVDINLQRVNPYPLTEIVTNFSEVKRALKGKSFEWMAYE